MSAPPDWAAALSTGAPPALVAMAVQIAAHQGPVSARVHAVVTERLARNAGTAADDVLAVLCGEQPLPLGDAPSAALASGLLARAAKVLLAGHVGYPPRLTDAWPELGAPLWLFCRGGPAAFSKPAVAVVGTRQPSHDGLRTAGELSQLLARHGVTVVSGLARGIDQAAHRGALAGGGHTIAVLGTGLDIRYPAHSTQLHLAIAARGAVVTEYPLGVAPRPQHFLARNRIIAGLADACVVVEGGARSGALQTARLAAEQGRDVLAVPGSLHAPASRAPLDLIRDGATPLTRLDDVLEVVARGENPQINSREAPPDAAGTSPPLPDDLAAEALAVLRLLNPVPAAVGVLARDAKLSVAVVMAAIGELAERGLAQATPRGVIALSPYGAAAGSRKKLTESEPFSGQ